MMAKLPSWAQSILRNAARLTAYNMSTATFAANAENWDTISANFPDVKIKEFPAQVMDALKESNAKLLESESQRSPMAKKIIDSRAEYLRKSRAWINIGQRAYFDTVSPN